uniref:Uncharacterized protein n=1 Tax=Clandestinovirus TaxID=2831644 RepID=A0A8F8KRC5_9VIRU|nr:hypothetical protein KOM_12_318 [Clandestinovirus]
MFGDSIICHTRKQLRMSPPIGYGSLTSSGTQRHPFILIDSNGNERLYSKMGKPLRKYLKNGDMSKAYSEASSMGHIYNSRPEWSMKKKKAAATKPFSLKRKFNWSDPIVQKAVTKLLEVEQAYKTYKGPGYSVPATKEAARVRAQDFIKLYRHYKVNPLVEPDVMTILGNGMYKYASCPTKTDACADDLKYTLSSGEKCCRKTNYYEGLSLGGKKKRRTTRRKKTAKKGKKAGAKKGKKTGAKKACKKGMRRSRQTGRCRKA